MDWLLRFDYELFRAINVGWHQAWLDVVFLVLTYTGLAQIEVAGALLLMCWRSTRDYVLPLLITLLISGLPIAQGLKGLVIRERPSNWVVAQPQETWFISSFPSGHTSIAFGSAFMLLLLTWDSPRRKWGVVALVWALSVGISRIYRGVHWPTDVLAGMFVGLFSASAVFVAMRLLEASKPTPEFRAGSDSHEATGFESGGGMAANV